MPVEGNDIPSHQPQDSLLTIKYPESGNMLIMTLSYTQRTNDKSLITTYVRFLSPYLQIINALTEHIYTSGDPYMYSSTFWISGHNFWSRILWSRQIKSAQMTLLEVLRTRLTWLSRASSVSRLCLRLLLLSVMMLGPQTIVQVPFSPIYWLWGWHHSRQLLRPMYPSGRTLQHHPIRNILPCRCVQMIYYHLFLEAHVLSASTGMTPGTFPSVCISGYD